MSVLLSYLRWPLTVKEPSAGSKMCCLTTLRKGIGGFRSLTGLASGTSYVPSNMTAELHRGESVLNARETQRRGTSQGMNIMNPQFVVNAGGSTTLDAKAFAQQLYQEFSKKLVTEARRV